ncbi:putative phloem protein [Helianthus debilis subsp. tardiflorus]
MIVRGKYFQANDSECIRFVYLLSPQTPIFRHMVDQNTHNPLARPKIRGLPRLRHDGWMQVQVSEFVTGLTHNMISMHVELTTSPFYKVIEGLTVQGIEFKPLCI